MIECKELANKVIGVFAIYEDGLYGPEVLKTEAAALSLVSSQNKHSNSLDCTTC
jgi:hypothetical protein